MATAKTNTYHKETIPYLSGESTPFDQIEEMLSTNVCTYVNESDHLLSREGNYYQGIFLGFRWECIEFARRWLLMRKSCIFPNIPQAANLWHQLKTVERVTDGKQIPVKCHLNGSTSKPQADSLLIYPSSSKLPSGHVAIICEVLPDFIRVAEQDDEYHNWSNEYSRQIPLVFRNNCYYIEDDQEVAGWIEIEDNQTLKPLDESKLNCILKQYQKTNSMGTLERCTIPIKTAQLSSSWLDDNDPAEKLFRQVFLKDLVRTDTDTVPYYKANQDLFLNIGRITNELHEMFLHATKAVLEDEELLQHFCVPEVFWPKIRQSWLDEQDLPMMGRFDLVFNGKEIKVLEYNADSAAALYDTSVIQEKLAQKLNFERTFMSGFQLHRLLVNNWKKFPSLRQVHILIDVDDEELLTAYYMQNILKDAKISSKICILTDDLFWKDSKIVDKDGDEVVFVWKLWMWETIFSDYQEREKQGELTKKIDGEHPYLCQIFFDEHIRVSEPIWKVIPSNKSILPVLWSLYPNHPNLLRSEWNLTNDLKQIQYVKKPIVGRCGHNVTLYDANGDSVLGETKGKFVDRNCVYQELFALTKFDGYFPIIGSWVAHHLFAGFGIREDKKLITDAESPVTGCGILWK